MLYDGGDVVSFPKTEVMGSDSSSPVSVARINKNVGRRFGIDLNNIAAMLGK